MKKDNRVLDKNENTSYDAAYKAVRTNIEFLHTEQDLKPPCLCLRHHDK